MANPQKVKRRDGKAVESRQIAITRSFIDADYSLEYEPTATISDTGLLVPFELKPLSGSPGFRGRWDEKASTLDIDILGVSSLEVVRFKHSEHGSQGHHAKAVPEDSRNYPVNISYRGRKIFTGEVQLGLLRCFAGHSLGVSTCKATATVTKADGSIFE